MVVLWLNQDMLQRLFLDLVSDWVGDLGPRRGSVVSNKSSHFYRGHLPDLPNWVQSSRCQRHPEKTSGTHILIRRGYTDLEESRDALRIFVLLFECICCLLRGAKVKNRRWESVQNRCRKLASITGKHRDKISRPLGVLPCPVLVSAGAERASAPRASAANGQRLIRLAYLETGRATHGHSEVIYKANLPRKVGREWGRVEGLSFSFWFGLRPCGTPATSPLTQPGFQKCNMSQVQKPKSIKGMEV